MGHYKSTIDQDFTFLLLVFTAKINAMFKVGIIVQIAFFVC